MTNTNISKLIKKAYVCLRGKRNDEALEIFNEILEIDQGNIEALEGKGTILFRLKKYEESINFFDKILVSNSNNILAISLKKGALKELGKFEEANKVRLPNIGILSKEPEETIRLLRKEATDFLNNKEYEKAINIFDKALRKSWDIILLKGKADALLRLGKHRDVLELYNQCLVIDSEDVEVLYKKGNILEKMNEAREFGGDDETLIAVIQESIDSYDQILAIDPFHSGALYSKGLLLCKIGAFQDAINFLDEVILNNPEDVKMLCLKGAALSELGRHCEATKIYDQVLSIDPENKLAINGKKVVLKNIKEK